MALVLFLHENLGKDKHVESLRFPRLDEGSIPFTPTINELNLWKQRFFFLIIVFSHSIGD